MKQLMVRRIIPFFISFIMLFGQTSFFVLADDFHKIEYDVLLSEEAEQLYKDCQMISYDKLKDNSFDLAEGVSVIYGKNISLSNILKDKELALNISNVKSNSKNTATPCYEAAYSNTYMVIFMKNGKRIDANFVSVEYACDVSVETIDRFVNAELSKDTMDYRVKSFINDQVSIATSAYNYSIIQEENNVAENRANTTQVVLNVRDEGYYIANYVPNATSTLPSASYPVMIYKKNITYQAISVADVVEDSEFYVIVAFVTVIPGNDMSSFTAAEYASMSAANLYNNEYANAISIKAIKTSFENLFPEYDYFIDMSPKNGLSDAEGLTVPVSLGIPPSVSTSFNINVCAGPTVDMDVVFNPYGVSSIKFEAYKNWNLFFPIEACLITEPFSYTAGVYMQSGGYVLYMNVATEIKYYFVNAGEDSAVWVGSESEMYYENYEP